MSKIYYAVVKFEHYKDKKDVYEVLRVEEVERGVSSCMQRYHCVSIDILAKMLLELKSKGHFELRNMGLDDKEFEILKRMVG